MTIIYHSFLQCQSVSRILRKWLHMYLKGPQSRLYTKIVTSCFSYIYMKLI